VEALLEVIALEVRIGECRSHAVLAESAGLDAQFPEHGQNGRWLQAVTLELDDDQSCQVGMVAGHQVVETQVGVDGEALGLGLIDQRDAVEAVLQVLGQHSGVVVQMLAQELVILPVLLILPQESNAVIRIERIKVLHVNTFLLGSAVVVLGLHLEEVEARINIGSNAQLLSSDVSIVVNDVHVVVGSVEVGRVVGCQSLPVNHLCSIIIMCKPQKHLEPFNRCDKLGVGAVHQLDATHLVE